MPIPFVEDLIPIPPGVRGASLARLSKWVIQLSNVEAREERVEALARIFDWVMQRDEELALGTPGFETRACDRAVPRYRRAHVLIELIEASTELSGLIGGTLAGLMSESSGLRLFAEGGLPQQHGLIDETTDRIVRKLFPQPRDERDLAGLILRLFPRAECADWIEELSPELFSRLIGALRLAELTHQTLHDAMRDALPLLAARVQMLGLNEAMRARQSIHTVRGSCWHRLQRSTDDVTEVLGEQSPVRAWSADIADCRAATREVLAHLETTGVSVALVHAIDTIERSIERMELVQSLLASPSRRAAQLALADLLRARHADSSVIELARENSRLLARKVVERAADTGEHYIATTRREYFTMWGSAAIGGVITVATAAIKTVLALLRLPIGLEGFSSGLNYAASFVLIGHVGGTLATKQPSMTGAALADVIQRTHGEERAEELVTTIARIVRSQLAAAFGNVIAVGVGAYAFDFMWQSSTETHFLDPAAVDYVLASLHPFHSGTAFYAALTGAILWLSSLLGGAAENWAVYRQIPRGIADHPFGHVIGVARMAWISRFVERNLASWSVSIVLGFMLGFTPILGKFLGLPLDVRHVTLSMGQLCLALSELDLGVVRDPRAGWALVGIAVTFVMNLSVSFGLALRVALRARGANTRDLVKVLTALRGRLWYRPREFLLPPKT